MLLQCGHRGEWSRLTHGALHALVARGRLVLVQRAFRLKALRTDHTHVRLLAIGLFNLLRRLGFCLVLSFFLGFFDGLAFGVLGGLIARSRVSSSSSLLRSRRWASLGLGGVWVLFVVGRDKILRNVRDVLPFERLVGRLDQLGTCLFIVEDNDLEPIGVSAKGSKIDSDTIFKIMRLQRRRTSSD